MELYLPIILDGATGTQLARKGYDGKVCAEKWTCEHPESVMWLHGAYSEAGSDIVYAPTFQANEAKLAEAGLGGQTAEINKTLVGLSKKATCGKSYVAGDISPIGRFIEPFGDSSFDEIYDVYLEQIRAQEEAGVDLYAAETQMTVPESRATFLAAKAMKAALDILRPRLVSESTEPLGRACIGTVQGDLHDIGKNLVRVMLEGSGIEVIDLGTDVSAERFVETAREEACDIICCSSLLTTTVGEMRNVVDACRTAGIRDDVIIMVGGALVTQGFCDDIGADIYSEDAGSAARKAV